MQTYCHVEDGVVDYGPGALPRNWRNITRFDLASPELLKANNWLPVTTVDVVKGDDETDDGHDLVVGAEDVTFTPKYRAMTADEITGRTNSRLLQQIAALEETASPRRVREAIKGQGKVWLDNLDDEIIALREQLT